MIVAFALTWLLALPASSKGLNELLGGGLFTSTFWGSSHCLSHVDTAPPAVSLHCFLLVRFCGDIAWTMCGSHGLSSPCLSNCQAFAALNAARIHRSDATSPLTTFLEKIGCKRWKFVAMSHFMENMPENFADLCVVRLKKISQTSA